MYMTSYEPWTAMRRLQGDLTRLLGEREDVSEDDSSIATSRWTPAVDIKEEDGRFVITADVPGVDVKDIDVTMANGMLTIKGERKLDSEHGRNGYRRVERAHGTFYRRFSLPDYADPERISASCKDGVLEVYVPKLDKVQPRRIEVKA